MKLSFPTELATTSEKKAREWNAISKDLAGDNAPAFTVLDAKPNLIEIQHLDVVQVVITKALDARRKLGRSVLVEDSGYEIEELGGFPGALYGPTEKTITNAGYCKLMEGKANRNVKMKIAVGFASENGENVHISVGELPGIIPYAPEGPDDFGYDNIHRPQWFDVTLAQMEPEVKNRISARRKAIEALLKNEWSVFSKKDSPLFV